MFDDEKSDPTRFSFAGAMPEPHGHGEQVEERRSPGPRHMSILRVGKVVTKRGEDLCLIRNISCGGLMARVYTKLEVGQHVIFELRADKRLPGIVRWTRDDAAGIQFDTLIDVDAVLADKEGSADHRPRAPRLSKPCKATLRVGAHYHRVIVRDVSQGGVKIALDDELAVGAEVVLTMEGFRAVAGIVRWSRDGHAGIAFNQVIAYPELTGWLKDHAPD